LGESREEDGGGPRGKDDAPPTAKEGESLSIWKGKEVTETYPRGGKRRKKGRSNVEESGTSFQCSVGRSPGRKTCWRRPRKETVAPFFIYGGKSGAQKHGGRRGRRIQSREREQSRLRPQLNRKCRGGGLEGGGGWLY